MVAGIKTKKNVFMSTERAYSMADQKSKMEGRLVFFILCFFLLFVSVGQKRCGDHVLFYHLICKYAYVFFDDDMMGCIAFFTGKE